MTARGGRAAERPGAPPRPTSRSRSSASAAASRAASIDPESFWRLLDEGVDAISEVPRERWDVDALYDPDPDARAR